MGIIWDESDNQFSVVKTTDDGSTVGNVNISDYADIKAKNIILDNSTLSSSLINKIDNTTDGILEPNRIMVPDDNKHLDELRVSDLYIGSSGSSTKVISSAAEINLLNNSQASVITNGKAVIYGQNGEINASILKVDGNSIDATPSEINILSGVNNVTKDEINYLSGLSQNIQTQINSKLDTTTATDTFSNKTGSSSITTVVIYHQEV